MLARATMAMAVHCLGNHRRDWAAAMEAEFDAATEAGEPLRFAFGCLIGAWRELPAHEEGRFALASYLLAIGMLVPMAALLLSSVALGAPYLIVDDIGGSLPGRGLPDFAVTDANRGGIPALVILTLALGFGHLAMAWALLDRQWRRVVVLGRIAAAAMVTAVMFTSILFLQDLFALRQTTAIAVELAAVWLLVRWHDDLPVAISWTARPQRS